MPTVTATGISGIARSTAIGVPETNDHGITIAITTIAASTSHSSWRRRVSSPRR